MVAIAARPEEPQMQLVALRSGQTERMAVEKQLSRKLVSHDENEGNCAMIARGEKRRHSTRIA